MPSSTSSTAKPGSNLGRFPFRYVLASAVACGSFAPSLAEALEPSPLEKSPSKATGAAFSRAGCYNNASDAYFFGERTLYPESLEIHRFLSQWFSTPLRRMREPSTSCGQVNATVVRLLILPSWGRAKSIRVTASEIIVKGLSGNGGYDPGRLVLHARRKVYLAERHMLARAVDDMDFWSKPTTADEQVRDGTMWVLEVRSAQRHHVVARALPTEFPEFLRTCRLMRRLGGINYPRP